MPGLSLPFVLPAAEQIAIPFVALLISFLSYSSQVLFFYIEPEPLSQKQAVWFNISVAAIWWCYWRACTADPGRKGWVDTVAPVREANEADGSVLTFDRKLRWCKKCDAVKPPRAHHCRKCGRYATCYDDLAKLPRSKILQMYPENGSPLSMDYELCLPHNLPTLLPLRLLCRSFHVNSRIPPLYKIDGNMG